MHHKHTLMLLAYLVILSIGILSLVVSGIARTIWQYDITYLSTIIVVVWLATEIVGAVQLMQLSQKIATKANVPDENSLWNYHSFVNFMGEIIVALGIFGTVFGVIIALMPFFGTTNFDPTVLQPQLLKMFAGLAVAFIPTALSILAKIFLDFHSRIHQNAVLDLLGKNSEI